MSITPRRKPSAKSGTCFRAGGQFLITKKEEEEERGKELETTTKKTEQAPNRPPPSQSIGLLIYITCVYCTRELNNCIFYTISFHRISHRSTGNKYHPSQISSVISSPHQHNAKSVPPEAHPAQYRPSVLISDRQSAYLLLGRP